MELQSSQAARIAAFGTASIEKLHDAELFCFPLQALETSPASCATTSPSPSVGEGTGARVTQH